MELPCQCTSDEAKKRGALRPPGLLPLVLVIASARVAAAEQGAPPGQVPAQQGAAQEQTLAAFKQKDIDFYYRSFVAPFSCNDLQNRVAVIMHAVGARDDVNVSVNGCETVVTPSRHGSRTSSSRDQWGSPSSSGGWQSPSGGWTASASADPFDRSSGGEQSAHVHVRAMMPVVVTPEVLNEMEKDKSRRELISRVTGNPAARMDVPVVFHATRQQVTLSHRTIKLEPEDCELLEQMSRSIFRELGVRTVGAGPNCDRREVAHMAPQMTVEALLPVPPPAGPKLEPGGEGPGQGEETGQSAPATPAPGSSDPATAAPPEQTPKQ
jgi:hypothetical protein